jgi:ABC-type sugar transport system ATPase subunit
MLSILDLKKTHGQHTILNIKNLTIHHGEICCFSGPNGAGKSTFLEILAGLIPKTSGSILWHGQPITNSQQKKIIMVLQNPLMFDTTVANNIAFGLKANKIPVNEHPRRIAAALQTMRLENFAKRQARTLSGGEKQRTAIARALVLNPEILLLDEPTAGLDQASKNLIAQLIKQIHQQEKKTFIIASHDIDFLLSIATATFSLNSGSLIPLSIRNLFHGRIEANGLIQVNQLQIVSAAEQNGDINFVIPPEAVVLAKTPSKSSMRNSFSGQVTKMAADGEHISVWIDIGIEICSTVTRATLEQMKFTIGDQLWTEFKANAIKVY